VLLVLSSSRACIAVISAIWELTMVSAAVHFCRCWAVQDGLSHLDPSLVGGGHQVEEERLGVTAGELAESLQILPRGHPRHGGRRGSGRRVGAGHRVSAGSVGQPRHGGAGAGLGMPHRTSQAYICPICCCWVRAMS